MSPLKRIFLAILLGIMFKHSGAQPYIDVVKFRTIYSPGLHSNDGMNRSVDLQNFNLSLDLPIRFKKSGDVLLISPFVENWKMTWADGKTPNHDVWGIALPVGYLKQFNPKLNILAMFIPRINSETPFAPERKSQFGGLVLAGYKLNENLVLKVGAYYNQEFFGPFFIPLVGIDWKINDRSNLFGTLPNQLVYERRASHKFFYGAACRFITNSYALSSSELYMDQFSKYVRLDENELGAFVDYYLAKKLVINFEMGYSLFRKIETGVHYKEVHISEALDQADGPYFKLTLAYRIRIR